MSSLLDEVGQISPQDIAKDIYYATYRQWAKIALLAEPTPADSNWQIGNYQVHCFHNDWSKPRHICVVDRTTNQPAIEFIYQPGQYVPKGDRSVQVGEQLQIRQWQPQQQLELVKAFVDPMQQAVMLAKAELEHSDQDLISTAQGLIFERQSNSIAVYSFREATPDGAMMPIAKLFADGSLHSVAVSPQTASAIRSMFAEAVDQEIAQTCQREAVSYSPIPDQKTPPLTTTQSINSQGIITMATAQAPEQKAAKGIEFDFFKGGGANVFAGQRTAFLAQVTGAEVKEASNGMPYMTMTKDQASQAIAVCDRKEWKVEKVSSKEWAPRAQDTQKAQVAIVAEDMMTVAKANLYLAQNAPDHRIVAGATVAHTKDGQGLRIEKNTLIFGVSAQGNTYVADKRLTEGKDGAMVTADPETNKRAAIIYAQDAQGKEAINRIADANKLLDRPLDFSKAAENSVKAVTEVEQQISQKAAEAAAKAEPAKAKTKAKAKSKAKSADLEID